MNSTNGNRCGAWAAGLAAAALLLGTPARAADEKLLDMLLQNGAITQEQHDELMQKEDLTTEDVEKIVVSIDHKGLRVRTADDRFAFKVGGRLHTQAAGAHGALASATTDGIELRRARLDLEATLFEDWLWKGEVDFADNGVSVKDFYVGYAGFDWGQFYVGHQKQPYALDLEMSSNDLPFIERGTDVDLIVPFVDRAIGVRTDFSGDHWYVAAGFYGDSVSPNDEGDEGWGAAARAVVTPILTEDRVVHVGMKGAFRDPTESMIRLRSETTHFSNVYPVNTGEVMGVERVLLVGPEFAAACGPFSLTGEYSHLFVERSAGSPIDFNSWNVAATWTLTGESRAASYSIGSGEFKRLTPAEDFSLATGGIGAWELATRYAAIDLNDGDVIGGAQGVYTLGLNWYLNRVVRLMFEWSRIVDTSWSNREFEGLNTFQGRVQISF